MRAPVIRAGFESLLEPGEMCVDSFAGGGGASTGIEGALGRPVDIAINHSAVAISMHKANHPHTRHYQENILEVAPREVCGGRRVGFAWFSPDCTHFSKAKGAAPRSKEIRGLAWVVIEWAKKVRPRVIVLENVEEFQTWGPVDDSGQPIKADAGSTFREWLGALTSLGYHVEFRSLIAADYGAPTTRKRLFLVARCDGKPIVWPGATHGKHCAQPWRPAAEIIDWSLPAPSIFGRRRPLAEATLKRIAEGIRRYVIHSAQPFIVRHGHYSTITGAGLREGCGAGTFRGQSIAQPLATVCATNDKHVVCPVVTKHYGGVVGIPATAPLGTVTTQDHHALTAAKLQPARGTCAEEVRAFLLKYYGAEGQPQNQDLFAPLHTVTTNKARSGLGIVHIGGEPHEIVDIGMRMLQPHELFAAQGFPADYNIAPLFNGRPLTKTDQTALAGNSVCPDVARAVVTEQLCRSLEAA